MNNSRADFVGGIMHLLTGNISEEIMTFEYRVSNNK